MSNQYQNITTGLAQLKNYYEGPIVSQFSDDNKVYRTVEKDKKSWSGLQVVRPLKTRRNGGIGATSDGGNLPNVGRQGTVQTIIAAKYNYLRFGITAGMIAASQSNVGSFVRSASYELEEGYNDLKNDLNRQFGDDGTGYLATLSAAAVATTSLSITGRESGEAALKFLDVGMVIDIYTTAGVLKASAVEITAVSGNPDDASATLTLSAAVTAASGDVIVRSGSYGNEIQGILTALDGGTTTIYNIDRSTAQAYQGNVFDLAAAQLTIDKMQQAQNAAERRGGAKLDAIMCDFDSLRMYQKLLSADKRYVNTLKGDGGFSDKEKKYLEFNGLPVVPDKDMKKTMVWLDKTAFINYVLWEMKFADETGTMYIAGNTKDELEVRIRFFANMFNQKPSACARLLDYVSP